ncbi:hypothetical protein CkaCkLH20_09258 [Colletotrichum karsti]|uniref:Uncharacterized protein n=1 Tax=Colletotrichum karsti TaxID=1095194 RepID=A0A9P6I7I7_9PEZI|nr:uncharacterized protein CkaCkLH20_09258 [Colletotrichum karsti]KAF9873445.1 hypothetical protein CkaCkLH20_09258 [Colletotrichum karsti]
MDRRDRGTAIIAEDERIRRVAEAKDSIRQEAQYTPALLGRIKSRIEANAFRRCISDNTLYQSLCNSLKDKNLPDRERRPDLVDFLALEAILPVQYEGQYNRVLDDLFLRCGTKAWIDKAILEANHHWFKDQIRDARGFIRNMINKVDSQLLEIILEDLETNFWRENLKDNVLYKKIFIKIIDNNRLTQRDVLTVVALNGGKYPTEIFRHLVVKQNSDMLHFGNNFHARHALYDDEEVRASVPPPLVPEVATTSGAPLTHANVNAIPNINSPAPPAEPDVSNIGDFEAIAAAMGNTQKGRELRKKIEEMKQLVGNDCGALRAVRGGRVTKPSASNSRTQRNTVVETIEDDVQTLGSIEVGESGTTIIKRERISPKIGIQPRAAGGPRKCH